MDNVSTDEIEMQLKKVTPSSMTIEDRLERLPGAIYALEEEIYKLSKRAEEARRTIKTLEDNEFYRLKGTKNPKTEKQYTEAEARHVAVHYLKRDNEIYRTARGTEKRGLDEMAEKKRLLDFYKRMNSNAETLVRLKARRA